MKEIKLEIIRFNNSDVITTSGLCAYTGYNVAIPSTAAGQVDPNLGNSNNVIIVNPDGSQSNATFNEESYYHIVHQNESSVILYECKNTDHWLVPESYTGPEGGISHSGQENPILR